MMFFKSKVFGIVKRIRLYRVEKRKFGEYDYFFLVKEVCYRRRIIFVFFGFEGDFRVRGMECTEFDLFC